MGIYDREYYRRDGPSFLGSFSQRGTICKWLIGANIVVFLVQLLFTEAGGARPFTDALILNVDKVLQGEVWRLLTYAFLHDTAWAPHILFNMLFLWWFGSDMEDLYGPREFLAFYLSAAFLGGVAFSIAHVLHLSTLPALGASGAVTAVLVLCACHYPTRIIRLFFILPVPIWLFVLFTVGMDVFDLAGGLEKGVAVAVHVGGAAFGFAYFKMQWRLTSLFPRLSSWRKRVARPRLRVYREEPPKVSVPFPTAMDDEHLEAKMDAVLEKISRTGKESLTDSELDVLRRASEVLKRRRP